MSQARILETSRLVVTSESCHWIYTVFGLLVVLITAISVANAQSKDRDNPTRLNSNEITGVIANDNLGDDYYYTFVAGPGEVTITLTVEAAPKSGIFSKFSHVGFEIFDENARNIASKSQMAVSGHTEQAIARLQLTRRQRLLLRISISDTLNTDTGRYRLHLGGAVMLNQNSGDIADITGISAAKRNDGNCLPKEGTLIIKMKDGSKKIIDLSEAETITVVP